MPRQVKKLFYIKERHNPQLGVYYVGCGQMTKNDAKKAETPLYGMNIMHPYETEAEYLEEICKLKEAGKIVQ